MAALLGLTLNLINLAPAAPLDGHKIAGAVWPWCGVVGLAVLAAAAVAADDMAVRIMVAALAVMTVVDLDDLLPGERRAFHAVPATTRLTLGAAGLGLAASLALCISAIVVGS